MIKHFCLADADPARLHSPMCLPIGARTPLEIAPAIAAQETAMRYGFSQPLGN